jgi:hypothetical protein
LSGLWHGAGWKFVLYGIMHGIALIFEFLTKKWRKKIFGKLPPVINTLVGKTTTIAYVSLSWVFFRAVSINDAFIIFGKLGNIWNEIKDVLQGGHLVLIKYLGGIFLIPMVNCVLLITLLELVQSLQKKINMDDYLQKKPVFLRWTIYYCFVFAIIYFGVFGKREFIYFQF